MKQWALFGRLFLVAGVLGGLGALAHQPAQPARPAAPKPAAAQVVPVFLIDRTPHPEAVAPRSIVVDRDPPEDCFAPVTPATAKQRLACG
ncbi:hypothetical protein SAMN06265338_101657 [Rhodoblastus acidophilus]|uniref:Uncharacterized protein n=1 Tax=Rhodoblastus acidophilus TaxID=1074 RepID=A0A212QJX1_RHOAC|nr:hypothetical protein [Rhodoblastus acidophilus]MCW2316296.1 hypothetical protein [Rhodoblastus acidophilus]PPQ39933.1 hypothetical protein CKO16_03785 [Rhodoblastus acidophilus]RAI23293.1 hypothetical protein CH337_03410 [Rhodoblastus acidophilus]SNB59711.1 hypothetical protein SAMN06265338_101657 [Rhodoblastus acidophilus]